MLNGMRVAVSNLIAVKGLVNPSEEAASKTLIPQETSHSDNLLENAYRCNFDEFNKDFYKNFVLPKKYKDINISEIRIPFPKRAIRPKYPEIAPKSWD